MFLRKEENKYFMESYGEFEYNYIEDSMIIGILREIKKRNTGLQ